MVDPLLWDCEVSDNGHLQIENLNKKIKEMGLTPDVVLISPLTRALTTAIGGFQHHVCSRKMQKKTPKTQLKKNEEKEKEKRTFEAQKIKEK